MESCPPLYVQSTAWAKLSGARLLLIGAAMAGLNAQGFELGPVQMQSGLGQPLSLQLPVRWAPGEARSTDCLKVRVDVGERHLSAADLQQSLFPGADAHSALVWVRSTVAVMEPVVMLSVGCPVQQVMALVDPVQTMVAPSGGIRTPPIEPAGIEPRTTTPTAAARPIQPKKLSAERPVQRSLLRMDGAGLPPLSMADPETPGLRWRFDSDLDGGAALGPGKVSKVSNKPAKDVQFFVRPGAPGASLLMAIDVGRPAGPADLLMAQDGPARLERAQAQFSALQADHKALQLELTQLEAKLAERESDQRAEFTWIAGLVLGAAALAGLVWTSRRHRQG